MAGLSFGYVITTAFFVMLLTIFVFPIFIRHGLNQFGKNASNVTTGNPFRVMNWKGRILYAFITTTIFAIVIGMELDILYFWKNPLG